MFFSLICDPSLRSKNSNYKLDGNNSTIIKLRLGSLLGSKADYFLDPITLFLIINNLLR